MYLHSIIQYQGYVILHICIYMHGHACSTCSIYTHTYIYTHMYVYIYIYMYTCDDRVRNALGSASSVRGSLRHGHLAMQSSQPTVCRRATFPRVHYPCNTYIPHTYISLDVLEGYACIKWLPSFRIHSFPASIHLLNKAVFAALQFVLTACQVSSGLHTGSMLRESCSGAKPVDVIVPRVTAAANNDLSLQ